MIVNADVVVVDVPATVVVERYRFPPAFLNVHCARFAPADRASCDAVDEAIVSEEMLAAVVDVPMRREEVVAEKPRNG